MALIDIVKYEGNQDIFAWKYPGDELTTYTQLIVNESQAAVLYKEGVAYDVFEAGRHTLETANIPLLNKIVNLPFGKKSPFKAEVWFVNKAHTLDIKWGTTSPIQIQDPKYGIYVPLSAYGQFGITVQDPKAFLIKLVGTLKSFGRDEIINYFRGFYNTHVKDAISTYLVEKRITVLELSAYLKELSESVKEQMQPTFTEYGIDLLNFYIADISVPDTDGAVMRLKEALSKRAEMDIVGYDYKQERSFDTLVGAAQNEGSLGSVMGAGMGLGLGAGLGKTMSETMGSLSTHAGKSCPHCGASVQDTDKYCGTCSEVLNHDINKCPGCNVELKDGSQKFCHECGTQLHKTCTSCKTPLSIDAKFCGTCGKKVDDHE
ncbi:SPFH domain-containing protein [Erysipelothrix rhusiopathiae]|uniref:SPFH domain-containing protein n=1 Tax=Erysipelothrix rhusiopathiae TaxID=1648 RepID=UPI000E076DC9|nr:SPFH domain-containing protein [Erysipelothrix rhusiopathiae]MDE8256155.1 SPFH domain-containing protein [Erysipelothrix rhusiopathiae]STC98614.1 Putative virion core protein (lumpy skin disease virus) [Erysipelothrix rhusiopathiae]